MRYGIENVGIAKSTLGGDGHPYSSTIHLSDNQYLLLQETSEATKPQYTEVPANI